GGSAGRPTCRTEGAVPPVLGGVDGSGVEVLGADSSAEVVEVRSHQSTRGVEGDVDLFVVERVAGDHGSKNGGLAGNVNAGWTGRCRVLGVSVIPHKVVVDDRVLVQVHRRRR